MNAVNSMMDRRVKERLIGATILVTLIVLIVPEILSGPKRPSVLPLSAGLPTAPTRVVTIDLATSKTTPEPQNVDPASAASVAAESSPAARPHDDAPGADAPGADAPGAAAPATDASGAPAPSAATARAAAAAAGTGSAQSAAAGAPSAPPPAAGDSSPPNVTTLKAQETTGSALESAPSSPTSAVATPKSAASAEIAARRGWAVQLGSFASKVNAEKLMHQLQARGERPFT